MPNRPNVVLKEVGAGLEGVKQSLIIDPADNFLHLVGDQDSPGTNKAYGTDSNGDKGWIDIPPSTSGTGGVDFKFGRVEITSWNMDTTGFKVVTLPNGLLNIDNNVVVLSVIIYTDAGDAPLNLDSVQDLTTVDRVGGWGLSGTNEILLVRKSGQVFDSSSYSSTSVTRGYIYIMYS